MLTDSAARWLLVLHTALGVAAVGAATHLVLWLRPYLAGQQSKRRLIVRTAWVVLSLQLATFLCGNLMYPTYKVEVRIAYLENATAINRDAATHATELEHIAAREHAQPPEAPVTAELVRRAAHAARWFDVKEHWVALGMLAAAALLLILSLWDPRQNAAISPIAMTLAVIVAGTVWLGALIGVLTAAVRAV